MEDMEHAAAAFQQEHEALGERIAIQRDRLDNARRSEQDTIIEKPLLAAPERDYTNKLGSTQHPRSLEAPRERMQHPVVEEDEDAPTVKQALHDAEKSLNPLTTSETLVQQMHEMALHKATQHIQQHGIPQNHNPQTYRQQLAQQYLSSIQHQ